MNRVHVKSNGKTERCIFTRVYSTLAGLIMTGGDWGGSVGTGAARKLRRCLKVTEDQERQTEAASEAKDRQMKQGWRRDTEMTRMDAGG